MERDNTGTCKVGMFRSKTSPSLLLFFCCQSWLIKSSGGENKFVSPKRCPYCKVVKIKMHLTTKKEAEETQK